MATRAVLLVSRCAAGEGGKEAAIRVEPENAASAAVAQRAGFILAKTRTARAGHVSTGTSGTCASRPSDDLAAPKLT
ncbi:hypothetical protein ABZ960_16725 [Streptomyces pseudovenezuelae]|uniref:hypothetical protein n=1 Tax=Streptomyces pseudovenezuelae TaxID=67350 RepID=UPI0034A13A8E